MNKSIKKADSNSSAFSFSTKQIEQSICAGFACTLIRTPRIHTDLAFRSLGMTLIFSAYPKINRYIKSPVVPNDTVVAAERFALWLDGVSVGDPCSKKEALFEKKCGLKGFFHCLWIPDTQSAITVLCT